MGEEDRRRTYVAGRGRGGRRRARWRRIAIWGAAVLLLAALVAGGSSYLWFRSQISASNQRVDQEIIEALAERPSTTSATQPADTSSTATSSTATSSRVTTTLPSASTAVTSPTTTEPPVEAPTGMNLILIGSDRRPGEGSYGRSDTIMLVHIDPEKGFLSLLSVPRDLRVNIPGRGINKINAAYSRGGPALTIRTIQSVFGIDLDHYIEVDFNAFKAITDTLGGVYVDIDRSYNDGQIVFDPGYQLLDGTNALRYCRHRHDSSVDFGRMERQQRFLSAIREQALGWNLPLRLPGLIKALFGNVDTDLGANDILKLAYWGIRLEGSRMKLARLEATPTNIDGISYVVASESKIAAAVKSFFTPPPEPPRPEAGRDGAPPVPASLATVDGAGLKIDVINATGRPGQGAFAAFWLLGSGADVYEVTEGEEGTDTVTRVAYPRGQDQAAQRVALALGIGRVERDRSVGRITVVIGPDYAISGDQLTRADARPIPRKDEWRALAAKTSFPLAAPTYIPPSCRYSYQRAYGIAVGDRNEPAVRVGYRYAGQDQYLGVSETTWLDAPIASPGLELKVGDIAYNVVGTSTKCDHVWWVRGKVLHWVSNTLLHELTREQLITVALSTIPLQ